MKALVQPVLSFLYPPLSSNNPTWRCYKPVGMCVNRFINNAVILNPARLIGQGVSCLCLFALTSCISLPDLPDLSYMLPGSSDPVEETKAEISTANLLFVAPVSGLGEGARLVVADAIAAALRDASKPAVISSHINKFGPTVTGQIVEIKRDRSTIWLRAVWQLLASEGDRVSEVDQIIVSELEDWEKGSLEAINLIIKEVTPKIVDMVEKHIHPAKREVVINIRENPKAQKEMSPERMKALMDILKTNRPKPIKTIRTPQPTKTESSGRPLAIVPNMSKVAAASRNAPVKLQKTNPSEIIWGKPSFMIRSIYGAPGDGNRALYAEIRKALRKRDITVTEDVRQAAYFVESKVTVGKVVRGRQAAKIVWTVFTAKGEEVGRAIQENQVTAGSLEYQWGVIAEIVANSAADGIQGLFDGGIPSSPLEESDSLLPPQPELPHVPGKAPPPPS